MRAGGSAIIVLMGVSGVGKSSVMERLAALLEARYAEGDAFHSATNVAKMRAGVPLVDEDRWPWLRAISSWIGARELDPGVAIVTCSALRRRYRDVLCDGHPSVVIAHLAADPELIEARAASRRDHYMPASLLRSQLDTLEPLEADERGFVVVADRSPAVLAREIADRYLAVLQREAADG